MLKFVKKQVKASLNEIPNDFVYCLKPFDSNHLNTEHARYSNGQ